jgi:hypothetical protein
MKFEDWMTTQGLAAKSIKNYAGAIDGPLTEWGNGTKIRSISDPQEFAALAELISDTDIFVERNSRGKHMYSSALKSYGQYLSALSKIRGMGELGPFFNELASVEAETIKSEQFEPAGQVDARNRVLREVVRRQGQSQFRAKLIAAYEGRCAITGCSQVVTLEAAHITPYLGPDTNLIGNGLLLRADIHTLWDLGLVAVNPISMVVSVSPSVHDQEYLDLAGCAVFQPTEASAQASKAALQKQWDDFHGH